MCNRPNKFQDYRKLLKLLNTSLDEFKDQTLHRTDKKFICRNKTSFTNPSTATISKNRQTAKFLLITSTLCGNNTFRNSFNISIQNRNMASSAASTSTGNKLKEARSPYLLQHATNPVHWYPWGEEAFKAAKETNKMIFLSVGYSTCHWCHVMERESFESDEIAAVMNEHFINVKVDREERPDVDKVYMNFIQATSGGGGWPMSVFLTPSLKPVFGGTYFPPDDQMFGRPGFKSVLLSLAAQWKTKQDQINESGDKIIAALGEQLRAVSGTASESIPGKLIITLNWFFTK